MAILDQSIRDEALDPSRSFIVQAPAGSGKTELLTQRYLILLSHAKKAPEEIVAITFTRKAAAEMRNRILSALELTALPEPEKNNYQHKTWKLAHKVLKKDLKLNWQLLKNPNRLRIMTIDSLSAFLCRQAPLLTEWGMQPVICENASSLYKNATQRLLLYILKEEKYQIAFNHLLLHLDNRVDRLENLLIELLSHRDQWLSHILLGLNNNEFLKKTLENSLKASVLEKMIQLQNNIPNEHRQILLLLARHAGECVKTIDPSNAISHCNNLIFEKNISLNSFSAFLGLARLLLTQDGHFRKKIDKNTGFFPKDKNKISMQVLLSHLEKYDGLKEALQDVLVCPPTDYTASQWEAIQSLMQLLPILVAELSLLFREKEQIDFVELNMTALKALGSSESPTDLALYLDYQMRHLLIDEFQDTSVMHLQLLEKIITGWEQNDGRTIFIVGDPMQSIYRFRNAEVGLFLRVQQNGLGPIHLNTLTLTTNFRSGKNMVDWFNNAFDIVFPKSADISSGRIPYKKSHAANEKIMGNGCEFFPIFDDEKNEAELLTAKIEMCLKNNPIDSVAILVRARSHLIPITQSLREKNIPFHAVEIESLSENIAIRDCVSLTRALLHRADKIAWLAILRSPLCGCPLSDLLTISNYAFNKNIYEAILDVEKIQTLSQDAMWRLSHLKNKLKQFFDEKKLISFSQRVENIWIALGGPATLASEHEIEYVKNYFILLQNLSEQSDEINLDSLVESLDGLYAAPIVSQNARVQMMTIHKSKGLEFDHVFIPGLHRQATRDTEKLFRWLEQPGLIDNIHLILAPIKAANEKEDLIYQYLKYCENKKLDYEMTRLLYVAITRAKKSCSLFAMINQLPKKDSFLEKLWPVLESQLAKLNRHDDLKSCDQIITSHHVMINRLTTDWQPPSFVKNISEMTVESQKIQINIDLDIQKHKIIGTLLHEILEEISKSDLMHWKNMNHFPSAKWRSRLFALGLLPNQIEKSLNLIQTAIQKTLSDERGLWILKKHFHAKSEWALSFNQQGSVTQYVLDRSFIENNIRWIIDYKISAPKDNENLLDFLNQQKSIYETQLNQYAYILSHHESHEIKCALYFPLCQGWIAWNYVLNSSNTINISAAHQSPPI